MEDSRITQEQRRTDDSEGRRREAAYMAAQEDGYNSGFEGTGAPGTSLERDLSRELGIPYAGDIDVVAISGLHEPVFPRSRPGYGQSSPKSPDALNKRHKCPYCSTDFARHHNLKSHLLTHSQEKPYVCQTCNVRFRRLHDLKRHTKLHTGERPHICDTCGRRFARGDALARHNKGPGGCAGRRSSVGGEDVRTEVPERQAVPSTTLSHRLRSKLVCQTVSRDDTSSEDAKISAFVKTAMEPHVRKAQTGGLSRLDTSSFLLTRKPSPTPSEDVEYSSPYQTSSSGYLTNTSDSPPPEADKMAQRKQFWK